ncbi:MAG: universal stress protein [Candidimonas sp.]|nr:MAG: universal stress protein [Candidimonas sp.]
MFKKILIPTDGSTLSAQAANMGVSFAQALGAEIVVLHVIQPFAATIGFDGMAAAYAITDEDYDSQAAERAAKYLKAVLDPAAAAGIKAQGKTISDFNVAEGIVHVAKKEGCDLIFIGSHGRSGLSRLLLGSVTIKVLGLAKIAILVHHIEEQGIEEQS